MKKPSESANFAENDSLLLEISLIGRNFAQKPSEILKIRNEADALAFDRCCSYRLIQFDNERQKNEIQLIGLSVAAASIGQPLEFEDNTAADAEVW